MASPSPEPTSTTSGAPSRPKTSAWSKRASGATEVSVTSRGTSSTWVGENSSQAFWRRAVSRSPRRTKEYG